MRHVTVVLALLVATVLSACATGPTSTPTSSPPVTPSETATAEPQVAQIQVGAAELVLLYDDGTTFTTYGYFDDSSEIIGTLSGVLGEPTVAPYASQGLEDPAGTDTSWGGFTVRIRDFTATAPDNTNLSYVVTAATVGTVAISTPTGIAVGTPVSALGSYTSTDTWVGDDGKTYRWYQVDEQVIGSDGGTDLIDYVLARVDVAAGAVVEVRALGHNYGV